ncbi:hypothetical protein [Mycobacterium intracellulare]|uniref:hypothetical protein n=1 Tax=Mycobacterium intracellulare TaxID=1767 RepID=UPI001EEDD935|nr:hypothetical protein [Mycobacterium intracellulare]MEE3755223.1 hypothetical protein [Mycobacterium intracellulare]
MLIDCYGPAERGGINIDAIADYVGVTPSTVRRWVSGGNQHNRRRAPIPAQRIEQLQRGPALSERRNQQQHRYWLNARASVENGTGILESWRTQKWLEPHEVVVIAVTGKPWHQVAVTNGSRRAVTELRRRGERLESATVPTRIHAQLLADAVMTRQQNWRIHPTQGNLEQGRTQVWMADAPSVDLAGLAVDAGIPTALIYIIHPCLTMTTPARHGPPRFSGPWPSTNAYGC